MEEELIKAKMGEKGEEKEEKEEKIDPTCDTIRAALIKSKILDMELQLCDMMLKADERNFHCWNYRNWAVELYL